MKIETQTKKGTLTEININEDGKISVVCHNPQQKLESFSPYWGQCQGQEGIRFIADINKKMVNVCLTVPKADWDRAIEIAEEIKIEKIRNTESKVVYMMGCDCGDTFYIEGKTSVGITKEEKESIQDVIGTLQNIPEGATRTDSNMSSYGGWELTGEAAEKAIAAALEVARNQQAEAVEKEQQAEKAESERVEKCFAEAKETGEKVVIRKFTTDCNDPREECNCDIVTVFAMPDGTKETTRNHTY